MGLLMNLKNYFCSMTVEFRDAGIIYKRDFLFLTLTSFAALVPLVILRQQKFPGLVFINYGSLFLIFVLYLLWCRKTAIREKDDIIHSAWYKRGMEILWVGFWLGVLTLWQFHGLMIRHWWSGTDETMTMAMRDIWNPLLETIHARPLAGFPYVLAAWIIPNSFEGYLFIMTIFRFGTALCLYAAFRQLFQTSKLPAVAVSALYVLSPTESLRYLTTAPCYYSPVFFMSLAFWLYIRSYFQKSIPVLLGSFICIGVTLLQYESPMLLFLILPFLLLKQRQNYWWLWACGLYATCSIFGLRLIHHLLFDPGSYQMAIIGTREHSMIAWIIRMSTNGLILAGTIFRYFQIHLVDIKSFGLISVLPATLAIAPGFWSLWKKEKMENVSIKMIILTLVALFLIVLPHSPLKTDFLEDFNHDITMRLGFFTAVVQAVLLAIVYIFIAQHCSRVRNSIIMVALTWVTCALAVMNNHSYQAHNGNWNSYVNFNKTASLYRSLHAQMPPSSKANAFFIILPTGQPSQLGWAYGIYHGGNSLWGMPGYQGRQNPDGTLEQRFMTGYEGKYIPVPDCHYIIFKSNEDQTEVKLVSSPQEGPGKDVQCGGPPATPQLSLIDGKLPYFSEELIPSKYNFWKRIQSIFR